MTSRWLWMTLDDSRWPPDDSRWLQMTSRWLWMTLDDSWWPLDDLQVTLDDSRWLWNKIVGWPPKLSHSAVLHVQCLLLAVLVQSYDDNVGMKNPNMNYNSASWLPSGPIWQPVSASQHKLSSDDGNTKTYANIPRNSWTQSHCCSLGGDFWLSGRELNCQ